MFEKLLQFWVNSCSICQAMDVNKFMRQKSNKKVMIY